MTVVCDSTTIIALARAKSLHLLNRLFGEVIIPQRVFEEIAIAGRGRPGSQEVQQADFIKTKSVNDTKRVEQLVGPLSQADAEVVVLAVGGLTFGSMLSEKGFQIPMFIVGLLVWIFLTLMGLRILREGG